MGMMEALGGFFKKKRSLRVNFYDEAGKVITKNVKYSNNTFEQKINGEKQTYIIDHAYVNYDAKTNTAIASYYINNPRPIRFVHERNEELDSVSFKNVIDSKVIKDLFSDEDKTKMLLIIILIVVSILFSALTFAKLQGWLR